MLTTHYFPIFRRYGGVSSDRIGIVDERTGTCSVRLGDGKRVIIEMITPGYDLPCCLYERPSLDEEAMFIDDPELEADDPLNDMSVMRPRFVNVNGIYLPLHSCACKRITELKRRKREIREMKLPVIETTPYAKLVVQSRTGRLVRKIMSSRPGTGLDQCEALVLGFVGLTIPQDLEADIHKIRCPCNLDICKRGQLICRDYGLNELGMLRTWSMLLNRPPITYSRFAEWWRDVIQRQPQYEDPAAGRETIAIQSFIPRGIRGYLIRGCNWKDVDDMRMRIKPQNERNEVVRMFSKITDDAKVLSIVVEKRFDPIWGVPIQAGKKAEGKDYDPFSGTLNATYAASIITMARIWEARKTNKSKGYIPV